MSESLDTRQESLRGKLFEKLGPQEQEGIRELEGGGVGQVDLILAAFLGFKFSTIDIINKETLKELEAAEATYEAMFAKLGLKFVKQRRPRGMGGTEFETSYIIGKKDIPGIAKKYVEKSIDDFSSDLSTYHREFGALLGIPQTAIDAFIKGSSEIVPHGTEPYGKEIQRFLWFRPSKKHWKEEIKPVAKLARQVREVSPALYARIITGP